MNNLPVEIIEIIKELLDPVSYICFLETGSEFVYYNDYNCKQYNKKRIEYFNSEDKRIKYPLDFNSDGYNSKKIVVNESTIFRSISDERKKTYNFTKSGDYVLVGNRKSPMNLQINGKNIHINLNKRKIKLKDTITPIGNNISLHNGVMFRNNSQLIHSKSTNFTMYKVICLYNTNNSHAVHIAGGYTLIHTCTIKQINILPSKQVNKTKVTKKLYPKRRKKFYHNKIKSYKNQYIRKNVKGFARNNYKR